MEALKFALARLEKAEKALDNFRSTFYMPWEGEQPTTAEERRARDKLRDHGVALIEERDSAQKELISRVRQVVET